MISILLIGTLRVLLLFPIPSPIFQGPSMVEFIMSTAVCLPRLSEKCLLIYYYLMPLLLSPYILHLLKHLPPTPHHPTPILFIPNSPFVSLATWPFPVKFLCNQYILYAYINVY